MSKFKDLRVGMVVCDIDWDGFENFRVEAIGHDWAVLRNVDTGEVARDVLEPDDTFAIGRWETADDGSLWIERS